MSHEQCPYHSVHHVAEQENKQNYLESVIRHKNFVCIYGKAALEEEKIVFHQIDGKFHEPETAVAVCQHLYSFINDVLHAIDLEQKKLPLASCVIIFPEQHFADQTEANQALIQLLLNMHTFDVGQGHNWAPYVSNDPTSDNFSFSIGGEAFFLPLLYPHSASAPRRSEVTALVFNWHKLFEELRNRGLFEKGRSLIRKHTKERGFEVPALLADFGEDKEFPQYALPSETEVSQLYKYLYLVGGTEPFSAKHASETRLEKTEDILEDRAEANHD